MTHAPDPVVSVLVACTRPGLIPEIQRSLAAESRSVPCELLVAGDVAGLAAEDRSNVVTVPTTFIECDTLRLNLARRLMADASSGAVVAFLDDDAVPAPGWLSVAATLPPDSAEIWTGPEAPTRTSRGALLSAEIGSSVLAEGYRGHAGVGDHAVRWYEAPFCNLVVGRTMLERVGLPDPELVWDLDDFDFCHRAASLGARFRTRDDLGILHDRYPDSIVGWLVRKSRERRRTGEKLVRYPGIYLRVPSVVGAAVGPWAILGLLGVAGRRRRAVATWIGITYLVLVILDARRKGRRGRQALEFALGLVALHGTTSVAIQFGIGLGVVSSVLGLPDPNLPGDG